MKTGDHLIAFLLHAADNTHLLGHRNSEWTGHGPVLEQDIALSNIALDLIGQSRFFYQYAAKLLNQIQPDTVASEDSLAFLRDVSAYRNFLLVEQPNDHWGNTILRQFFFSTFQLCQYQQLIFSVDDQLRAIAEKALKEVRYHYQWSAEWVIRLGDGTAESHQRMCMALENQWRFTGEFFQPAYFEDILSAADIIPDPRSLEAEWTKLTESVLIEATLIPSIDSLSGTWMQQGGKTGKHSEHLGYILAEMQFLQRAYPGNEW